MTKKEKVLERDKKCRICGTKKNLTKHHIFPKGVKNRHKVENITILCRRCHDLINIWWNKGGDNA